MSLETLDTLGTPFRLIDTCLLLFVGLGIITRTFGRRSHASTGASESN
jgi:hypothetical protein